MTKRITFILFGLLILFSSQTQTIFSDQKIILGTGDVNLLESVFHADLDGDGDEDILSASIFDDKVAWYENEGGGNFRLQHIIALDADGAQVVFAIDIDGDTDLDVVVDASYDDKIVWYENTDGLGNFSTEHIITSSIDRIEAMHFSDFDNDGDMDVVSGSYWDHIMAWHENDGLGNFTDHTITTSFSGDFIIYATDIDMDNDKDILFSSLGEDVLGWYENTDGNGTFSYHLISEDNYVTGLYPDDIDGDGDMDVLISSSLGVSWYKNLDGNGNFGTPQPIILVEGTRYVHADDLDNDGDQDILYTNYTELICCENLDGNGNFGLPVIIDSDGNQPQTPLTADMDNDGDKDVIGVNRSGSNSICWYENTDGAGNFNNLRNIVCAVDGPNSIFASDLDNDNDMDILASSSNDDKISSYENLDGNGNIGFQKIITTEADGAQQVYAEDLDMDGDMDVLAASSASNNSKLAWYENDGNGNFGPTNLIYDLTNIISVYAADIDGDEDMDVLSTTYYHVLWFENLDGNGNFGPSNLISNTYDWPKSVFSADFDGDNDMDVLATSYNDDVVVWYENTDGNGSFGTPQVITTAVHYPNRVHGADIDNDGDIDVLSASSSDKKIAWYENDGNGNFGSQIIITVNAEGAEDVFAIDLDGDIDLDVLSASRYDDKVAWYENLDGNGSFGTQQIITTVTNGPRSIYATDLDGDGDADVMSVSMDNVIAWYENNPLPEILIQPQDQNACPNIIVTFSIDINYEDDIQWQINEGSGFYDLSNSGNYTGVSTEELIINPTAISLNGNQYRCCVSNGSGIQYSDTAQLFVEDQETPVITSEHENQVLYGNVVGEIPLPDYTLDVIASDNCDVSPTITQIPEAGTIISGADNLILLTVTDEVNNASQVSFNVEVIDTIPARSVNITAYLEGPFAGFQMNTNLNSAGLIPTDQPYSVAPWNYEGLESTASIPSNAVDWVLVELRDATDINTATPETIIGRRAGFLLSYGTIVDLDGISNLQFDVEITNQLYVVIYHRNHLPIQSASPLTEIGGSFIYDFTGNPANTYGGEFAQKELLFGLWGMMASNADGNSQINNLDKNTYWINQFNSAPGYYESDYNFDGLVNIEDKNIWIENVGKASIILE